ncbi:MAG: vWA domain-containing protein [Thermaurantimonas sp.]|uniref:vWA domain-containing protein n=1 Tax=Thermaurantimonas sp. TaxID=2681568 RepID=UPI00391B4B60
MKKILCSLTIILTFLFDAVAQKTTNRILFIFDSSNSMQARWESGTRMDVAKRFLAELIDSIARLNDTEIEVALRLYGHSKGFPPQDCNDTRLLVPFAPDNYQKIKRIIQSLRPMGTTPIANSLEKAADDFPPCKNCRNLIVLITDGIEECGGDPCAVSERLQTSGIAIRPFVIGIGLDAQQRQAMECVGRYYDAAREDDFRSVLGLVISQALEKTTYQINLLDANNHPSETDVAFTVFDQKSGKVVLRMMHTLNSRGLPDTLPGDPLLTYRIVVHSIPEVEIRDIVLSTGKHNVVAVPLPRGRLAVKTQKLIGYKELKILLRNDKGYIINIQDINTDARVCAGRYIIEVLANPPYRSQIEVKPAEVTTVEVPVAGVLSFQAATVGYGTVIDADGHRVIDLDENSTRHTIPLQPGRYTLVFRPRAARDIFFSFTKDFEIVSGSTTIVKAN